jgi:hypothetical protein
MSGLPERGLVPNQLGRVGLATIDLSPPAGIPYQRGAGRMLGRPKKVFLLR